MLNVSVTVRHSYRRMFAKCYYLLLILSSLCFVQCIRPQIQSFLQQCNVCQNVDLDESGNVSDCNCDFTSVNQAVTQFFNPLLQEITRTRFFRYFRADLDSECPFWQEEGSCMMEGCSVCACEEEEVPKNWITGSGHYFPSPRKEESNPGWITSGGLSNQDEKQTALMESASDYEGDVQKPWTKGGLTPDKGESQEENQYIEFLRGTEDDANQDRNIALHTKSIGDIFWTDMAEDDCARDDPSSRGGQCTEYDSTKEDGIHRGQARGTYINLLENPEGYTGYSGESPRRVWKAIQEENCFGDSDDQCLEKRVFYRLMSGLQSSISTHVAKEYYFEHSGTWGHNIPLYIRAVGSHKERLDNLYFAFLFTLRAVVKAADNLVAFSYDTGHPKEDQEVRRLVSNLVHASLPSRLLTAVDGGKGSLWSLANGDSPNGNIPSECKEKDYGRSSSSVTSEGNTECPSESKGVSLIEDVQQCRSGFDERDLFQVPSGYFGPAYLKKVEESSQLRESFQQRFQNITRIMDCVTCDRCRVWGKLQILGLGTAIRILLSSDEVLSGSGGVLSRQEVIALINALHQLSTSVVFASKAAELELDHTLDLFRFRFTLGTIFLLIIASVIWFLRSRRAIVGKADEGSLRRQPEKDRHRGDSSIQVNDAASTIQLARRARRG